MPLTLRRLALARLNLYIALRALERSRTRLARFLPSPAVK